MPAKVQGAIRRVAEKVVAARGAWVTRVIGDEASGRHTRRVTRDERYPVTNLLSQSHSFIHSQCNFAVNLNLTMRQLAVQ